MRGREQGWEVPGPVWTPGEPGGGGNSRAAAGQRHQVSRSTGGARPGDGRALPRRPPPPFRRSRESGAPSAQEPGPGRPPVACCAAALRHAPAAPGRAAGA